MRVRVPDQRKDPGNAGAMWKNGAVTAAGMRPSATMGSENSTRTSAASASEATSPRGAACATEGGPDCARAAIGASAHTIARSTVAGLFMWGVTSDKERKSIAPPAHLSKKGAARNAPSQGPRRGRDADARTRRVDPRTRPPKCPGGQIEVHWAASQVLAGDSIVYETVNGAARGQDIHRQIFEKNVAVQLLIEPDTGRIVEANPAACAFYGYARDELIQRKITDINSLPVSEVHAAMGQATGERKNTFRFRHRLATGDIRDVEVHSGPIEVDGRRLLYSIVHDV